MSLVVLVIEYHEELELDLLDRGVDLLDFWRGTLSPRRLDLLIRDLSPKSRVVAKLNPDAAEMAQWGTTDYLLAGLFDITNRAHFQSPKPLPRPADSVKIRRRHAALEAQAERLSKQVAATPRAKP